MILVKSDAIDTSEYDSDEDYDDSRILITTIPYAKDSFAEKKESIRQLTNKAAISLHTFFKYVLKYPRSKRTPRGLHYSVSCSCKDKDFILRNITKCLLISLKSKCFECYNCHKLFIATYDEICLFKKHHKMLALKLNRDKYEITDLDYYLNYYNLDCYNLGP
ncbi:hypothetical protein QLX08_004946 [Tetragonisca angustula]|uniref:C2H2-type domain-containing protein n=1 Tax=Tetragonisca angustula TaxID=166442 RepID=A0AAW1A3E9_9HYME